MLLNETGSSNPSRVAAEPHSVADVESVLEQLSRGEFTRAVAKVWLPILETAHALDSKKNFAAVDIAPGVTLLPYIERLRRALDPIEAEATACLLAAAENAPCCSGEAPPEPTPEQQERAEEDLLREALYPFHARAELREFVRRSLT